MRLLIVFVFSFLVAGCVTTGGTKITDFSDRSVGYGWLDIDQVDANRLHSVVVYQYAPKTDVPYFDVAVKEFQGGYLYYTFAFPKGAFGTYSATGQYCIGLCGNTIYQYDFGRQGAEARIEVTEPGVYHFGNHSLKEIDTGFFEQGKFEIVPARSAPSDADMLREMLKDASDKPQIEARIRAALATYE